MDTTTNISLCILRFLSQCRWSQWDQVLLEIARTEFLVISESSNFATGINWRCYTKKLFLKNSQCSHENPCARASIVRCKFIKFIHVSHQGFYRFLFFSFSFSLRNTHLLLWSRKAYAVLWALNHLVGKEITNYNAFDQY